MVSNKTKKEGTINIYGVIGGFDYDTWEYINTSNKFLKEFKQLEADCDTIHVHINSPGGFIHEGIAIYNALYASEKEIITYNDGIAYSMGSNILMVGDTVKGFPNSLFMTHNASTFSWGNAKQLRDEADVLDAYDEALSTAYQDKLGISAEEVSEKYLNFKDNFFTAKKCKELGFYDEILENPSKKVPDNIQDMSHEDIMQHYGKMNFEFPAAAKKQTPTPAPTPITQNNKEPKALAAKPAAENNTKPRTMSKEYKAIEAATGNKFAEGEDANGILLNEQEAAAVEAALNTKDVEIASLNTEKQTAEDSLTALKTKETTFLEGVNTELGLEGDDQVKDMATAFTALKNKINEVGAAPGASHTKAGDDVEEETPHEYLDFADSIYGQQ